METCRPTLNGYSLMGPLLLQVLLNVRENGFIGRVDTISSYTTFLQDDECTNYEKEA